MLISNNIGGDISGVWNIAKNGFLGTLQGFFPSLGGNYRDLINGGYCR